MTALERRPEFDGLYDVTLSNTYDVYGRVTKELLNGQTRNEYVYDNRGNVERRTDHVANLTTAFDYDQSDRVVRTSVYTGDSTKAADLESRMQYTYTQSGKVGTLSYQEKGGDIRTYSYTYDKDEKPTKAVYPDKSYTTWTYDTLRRNTKAVYSPTEKAKDTKKLYTLKTYKASNLDNNGATKNATTAFVSSYTNQFGSSGKAVSSFNYTYDNWSNIKSITNQSGKTHNYTYNNFGEVSSATEQYNNGTGKTYAYTYDEGGNILTENISGTISTYTYGNNTWKDLLTGYTTGGHTYAITYDGAGHPLNYMGAAMTWDTAGNLASIQKGTNPFLPNTTSSVTYTYLANGQRRTKAVGSNTTTYRYNNGLLLSQTTGTGTTAETLSFTYDTDGKPVSITYKQGSNAAVTYFYAYNGQGDVIALYNSSNSALVGSYEYDLWGKLISVTPASAISDPNFILTKNPFRYRGYYYDNETGYYYLNARYYDPHVRRFISADDMAYLGADGSITGFNLFAYCDNNPINGFDNEGTLSQKNCIKLAVGAAFLVGAIALTVATGGGAAVVAVGVAKVVGSVALSTAVSAEIGYVTNGKQGAIDGACDGFLWGSVFACGGAALKYAKVKGIGVHKPSYGKSSSNISQLLTDRPEFTGSNRDKLLSMVQDDKLASAINELYRPGATIGDGGTADALISEFYGGSSRHLIKARGRLNEINKLIKSGTLGLNDLDIAEALRDDLEYAIKLFE